MVILKKIFAFLVALALESVVGVPVITITLLLAFIVGSVRQALFWFCLGVFAIGIFYQISFVFIAVVLAGSAVFFTFGEALIKNSAMRLLVVCLLTSGIISYSASVVLTPTVFMNFLLSLALSLGFGWRFLTKSSFQKKLSSTFSNTHYN
ncbi:MAG: hypothetical protein WAU07_00715 [Microgenomates group bacterium]